MPVVRRSGRMRAIAICSIVYVAAAICFSALANAQSVTQTLAPAFSPLGELTVSPGSLTMTQTGTIFNSYTAGPVTVQYRIRTSGTGSGSITVKANADFSPTGGPTVSNLTYTCGAANLGTPCSGSQTVSTTTGTAVVSGIGAGACTGGSSPCSGVDPNSVTVSFALTNDPAYATGAYSVTLTFTISAS